MKKLNESASAGATSAGAVATVAQPLNYSMQRRMPPTNLFNFSDNNASNVIKSNSKKKK